MSRHSWRGIFIIIIILSIPCYLLGFWFLATSTPNTTPATATANPDTIVATNTSLPATETPIENSPTAYVLITPIFGFTQTFPTSVPIITIAPSATIAPSSTKIPTTIPVVNTAIPTETEQILLPPSDTPSAGG